MIGWARGCIVDLWRRYVQNRDILERRRATVETLARGKEREANALRRVAMVTGDERQRERARQAAREARRLREEYADDAGIDVLAGR